MLVDKVSEFAQLGPNWNGNGATPFDASTISRAKSLAVGLEGAGFSVFPTACGSIQFECTVSGTYVEFEVFCDRTKMFVCAVPDGTIRCS